MLKLLLGDLQPQQGEIRIGTNLQIAYFDQYRATLREDWSAIENVAEGRDFIEINGKRKHVHAYLQDFLFTPSAHVRRSRACPVASAIACCWRACSRSRPTCW